MARIFLCHASEDKPELRGVYERLKAEGFEPWLDEVDLLPGQNWEDEIEQALKTSDFVLVFLSTLSVDKVGYVQRDFNRALYQSEAMPEGRIHTIPVKLDNCEVPSRFHRHQWANLWEADAFDRIVQALRYGLEQRGEPVPEPMAAEPTEPPPQPKAVAEADSDPQAAAVVPPWAGQLEEWTNSIGMVLVRIPAGSFVMGSAESGDEADRDEKPAHRVEITQPFYMGKYPVTQGQWQTVMGDNPSRFQGDSNRPVEWVSWEDVQRFMATLNELEGVTGYRLPTEAQWEYACRAGTKGSRYHEDVEAIAWYEGNSNGEPHAVDQKQPNAWGLYDMLGNVDEWCYDGPRTYGNEAIVDPEGSTEAGADRVLRGGGWVHSALVVRATLRDWLHPGLRNDFLGFRCSMFRT